MTTISYQGLALAMLPTVAVLALMVYWSADAKNATYASLRMLAQLLLMMQSEIDYVRYLSK